jgi:hypothetical protein
VKYRTENLSIIAGVRYLLEHMDWLDEELGGYDDDYLIIDCPGAKAIPSRKRHTQSIIRTNRTIYTSPIPTDPSETPSNAKHQGLRCISCRVAIYGGQVQIFQVGTFFFKGLFREFCVDITRVGKRCFIGYVCHGEP